MTRITSCYLMIAFFSFLDACPLWAGELPEGSTKPKSRDYRADNNLEVVAQGPTFGVVYGSDYGLSDRGVTVGYHLEPNLLVGVELAAGVPYRTGHGRLEDVSSGGNVYAVSGLIKKFLGNSIFMSVGLTGRYYQSEVRSETTTSSYNTQYRQIGSMKVVGLGVTTAFGNQWQLTPRFILGLDWTSAFIPLFAVQRSYDGKSDSNEQTAKHDMQRIERNVTLFLPRLLIGVSF